jgi:prophage regulatory protein
MAEHPPESLDIMTSNEITDSIPYSPNHIRRLENAGNFPKRVRIGGNRVAWLRHEVEDWLRQRVNERDAAVHLKMEERFQQSNSK